MSQSLSLESIARLEAEDARAEVVARIMGRDVTRGELSDAFDRVRDEKHWIEILREAVVFFAGCRPTIELESASYFQRNKPTKVYRVRAVGYFAAVGA